jgi:hypothetical protein
MTTSILLSLFTLAASMMALGMAFPVELHGRRMPSYSSMMQLYQQSLSSRQSTLDFEEPFSNIFQHTILQSAGLYAKALRHFGAPQMTLS